MTIQSPTCTLARALGGPSRWVWLILLISLSSCLRADELTLSVDFSTAMGRFRPLHGINKGPLAPGGIFDVIREQTELGIPFTRLHDCGWPNPYVVDHHAVFPDPNADPSLPESYDFRLTDEYIDAVRKTGAEPIYRLGESIEHTTVKRFVHPPANNDHWAAVCVGIIRHYNEGWANGFHYNIRYWEIWNEPENRPAMWTGTDEQYLQLYQSAATAIKKRFPNVKVGGPAVGFTGTLINGEFQPGEFSVKFLTMCRTNGVPLDFFSWHCYCADPEELSLRARGIRKMLDSAGFTRTESHLNEWNYLPDNDWGPLSRQGTAAGRHRAYAKMAGAPGAAFVAASLLTLQDAPVDVCCFYHGELGGFGMFTDQGAPQKVYQALRAFHDLLASSSRVRASSSGKAAIGAGRSADGRQATLLVSNFADPRSDAVIRCSGLDRSPGAIAEIHVIDADSDYSDTRAAATLGADSVLHLRLKAPAIALIRLRPAAGANAKPCGKP